MFVLSSCSVTYKNVIAVMLAVVGAFRFSLNMNIYIPDLLFHSPSRARLMSHPSSPHCCKSKQLKESTVIEMACVIKMWGKEPTAESMKEVSKFNYTCIRRSIIKHCWVIKHCHWLLGFLYFSLQTFYKYAVRLYDMVKKNKKQV